MLSKGYGVRLTPSGGSATLIGGITNQVVSFESEQIAEATAGNIYARQGEITRVHPRAQFTSHAVGAVADLLGLTGACLSGGANPGAEFWELALDGCGKVKSGATDHRKFIIPNGAAVMRSISASHRQAATVQVEVLSYWDGTNDPIIISESQPAPTGLDDTHRFQLGLVRIGSHTIAGNLSIEIDLGNEIAPDGGDSDPFDSHIVQQSVIPRITLRTRDVAKFAASIIPLRGLRGTHANTEIVLRRRVNGTSGFSNTSDNIRITADVMANWETAFDAAGNNRGEASLTMTALDDGTNAPLVIATNFDPSV